MELLLLLLGGLAVGTSLWAAMGGSRSGQGAPPPPGITGGGGPVSRPTLPGVPRSSGQSVPPGQSIPLGRPAPPTPGLNEALEQASPRVRDAIQGEQQEQQRRAPAPPPGNLPHTVDDMVPRSSGHSHHRRALQNAEKLAKNGQNEEALELMERIKNRINDPEIKEKIDENMQAVQQWEQGLGGEAGGGMPGAGGGGTGGGTPEIIVPLTVQAIALENLSEGLKNISEGLVKQLQEAFQDKKGGGKRSGFRFVPADVESMLKSPGTLDEIRKAAGKPLSIEGEMVSGGVEKPEFPDRGKMTPEGVSINEKGEVVTDGWTDEDFQREWEKYKHLPLKDRRSGEDRRLKREEEYGPDSFWKDRRSGDDRRKEDLFKEREEFLERLERHKANKERLKDFEKRKDEEEDELALFSPFFKADVGTPLLEDSIHIEASRLEEGRGTAGEGAGEERGEGRPSGDESGRGEEKAAAELLGLPDARDEGEEREAAAGGGMMGVPGMAGEPGIPGEPSLPGEEGAPGEPGEAQAGAPPTPTAGEGVMGAPGMAGGIPSMGMGEEGDYPEIPPLDEEGEGDQKKPPPQEIHGVLELKPPEEDDAPFLTLTYDFTKIPDSFKLSQDYHTMEYVYYKYKPMLVKAQEFTRRKMLKNALNYYRVIKSQNIPPEFKRMVNRNIQDITEYLQKFLMGRG